jgi:membrane protein involved in D-alanine export
MLPFISTQFFLLSFAVVGFLYFLKDRLTVLISYSNFLFGITIIFATFFLPDASYLLGFLAYAYAVYYFFGKTKPDSNPLWGALVMALPLILMKFDAVDKLYKIIGMSYITFRTVQAMVDRKNYGEMSFQNFTSFILFPPTILAGPIDRSYRFMDDIKQGYANITSKNILIGWRLILIGLLMKYVVSELISTYWLSRSYDIEWLNLADDAYAYTAFLYFDFGGYSFMAMGLGYMLGIKVPLNFDRPYLAENPQDFWRRFHITLGSWLKDYFFVPTYKYLHKVPKLKSHKLLMQNISLMLTFMLMGCWNGLNSHYIFSGFLFGTYSVAHNSYINYIKLGGRDYFAILPAGLAKLLKIFLMINAAVLALYFFSGRI